MGQNEAVSGELARAAAAWARWQIERVTGRRARTVRRIWGGQRQGAGRGQERERG